MNRKNHNKEPQGHNEFRFKLLSTTIFRFSCFRTRLSSVLIRLSIFQVQLKAFQFPHSHVNHSLSSYYLLPFLGLYLGFHVS